MAHLDTHEAQGGLFDVRQQAQRAGVRQRAQYMLAAAGLAAFGIVAVAAAMLTTLL